MVKLQRYSRLKSEINIVPLLDVLLVLLLIFIATVSIVTQSVEVTLPDTTDSQMLHSSNNSSVIIEVPSIGRYSVVKEQNRIDQLSSKQVSDEVKRYLNINPKTVFLIGGAKDVPYDEIIKALKLLHNSGVRSVGLITRPI